MINKELLNSLEAIQGECNSHSMCKFCPLNNDGFCITKGLPGNWEIEDFINANTYFVDIKIGEKFKIGDYEWIKIETIFNEFNAKNAVSLKDGTLGYFTQTVRVERLKENI